MPAITGTTPEGGVTVQRDDGSTFVTTPAAAASLGIPQAPTAPVPAPAFDANAPVGQVPPPQAPPTGHAQDYPDAVFPLVEALRGRPQRLADQLGIEDKSNTRVGPMRFDGPNDLATHLRNLTGQGKPAEPAPAPAPQPEAPADNPADFVQPPKLAAPAGGPLGAVQKAAMGQVPGDGISLRTLAPVGTGAPGVSIAGTSAAYAKAQRAAEESAKVGADSALQQSAYLETAAQEAEKRAGAEAARQQARQQFMEGEEKKTRALMDEASKSVGEVDAGRWWGSRTTGQKVLAGISAFLSGFGGGPQFIHDAIKQDIDLQRESLANKRQDRQQAVANQQSLVGMARARFGDELAADKAAEASALGIAQTRLQALLAKTTSTEALAKGKELDAQLGIQKEAALSALRERNAALALQRDQLSLQALETRAKLGAHTAGLPDGAVDGEVDPATLTPEQRKRFVPGLGLALDDESAKEVRKRTGNYHALQSDLSKLIAFRKEYGSETIPTEKLAAARAVAKRVELGLKEDGALGTLDNGSVEFLKQMTGGDIGAYGQVLPKLEALQGSIREGYKARLAPYMATRRADDARNFNTLQKAGG